MHGVWMFQMWWFWVLVIIAIAAILWRALRANESVDRHSTEGRDRTNQAPEDILDERLAKGEIDEPEYERRRRALRDED